MNFTPLVSPAVTPLDTQFQRPDYAASTDCFSPLTSPALRAQNAHSHHSVYGSIRGSDTSDTTSPIDPSLEYSAPTSGSTPASLRKSKRKTSQSSTKNAVRAVRQSPVVKPQTRRKHTSSSTVIPPKEIAGIIEEARKSKMGGSPAAQEGRLPLPYSQDSSGADSVSPEPLSEILMPPPATPKSNPAARSPYLIAKQGDHSQQPSPAIVGKEAPATPASLMRIRKQAGKAAGGQQQSTMNLKEQARLAEADMEQIMEDITLPEPANAVKKPALRPIEIPASNSDIVIPRSTSSKTPTAASAPVTATCSAFPSPTTSAMASPNGVSNGKRRDLKVKGRDPKRNSSSTQMSPALRPKISPSIKPLLPDGGTFLHFLSLFSFAFCTFHAT